jgi:4-alpha-glucanotransferase
MHVTSLPSPYGIGDLGPEARLFADFLRDGHQRYWQLLPVNPISKAAGYSPYSSYSSMAGKTLLISPGDLTTEGWLTPEELPREDAEITDVYFDKVTKIKHKLFNLLLNALKTQRRPIQNLRMIGLKPPKISGCMILPCLRC